MAKRIPHNRHNPGKSNVTGAYHTHTTPEGIPHYTPASNNKYGFGPVNSTREQQRNLKRLAKAKGK